MRRLSVRRSSEGGTLGSVVAGLSLGFAAGFLLRGLLGGIDRGRLRTLGRELTGKFPTGRPGARKAAAAVTRALAGDPGLAGIAFDVVPVRAGQVELHGWVPTRALRARAIRVAVTAAPGVDVTNRLSVRGEDDKEPSPSTDALQPA